MTKYDTNHSKMSQACPCKDANPDKWSERLKISNVKASLVILASQRSKPLLQEIQGFDTLGNWNNMSLALNEEK